MQGNGFYREVGNFYGNRYCFSPGIASLLGSLPHNVNWPQLIGVGMLAGIGFTMSLFIATLAFPIPEFQDIAKIGIIPGSVLSVIAGSIMLISFSKKLTSDT